MDIISEDVELLLYVFYCNLHSKRKDADSYVSKQMQQLNYIKESAKFG